MASKQLQDLKLSEDQAEQIIELGISLGAADADDMPESKKDKINAATEVVAHSLDAWIEDEIRPDDDETDVAEAGETIEKIFAIAGVSVDDDNEVTVGGAEASEDDDEDADEGADEDAEGEEDSDDDEDSDEEPFNPDDYIEGYSEMSVVAKVAKVKKLDADDDDELAVMEAIAEWENEQDKPSSRVLNYIDEQLGEPEGDTDETADEAGDDGDSSGEAEDVSEEPWEGYDKLSAAEVKDFLKQAQEDQDDPLTADQIEYVLEYEQAREKPPARKRVMDYCRALLNEMQAQDGGDDEPAEEAEAEPEKPKRGRGKKKAEPKAEEKAEENGMLTISLNGDTLGEFDAAAVLTVIGSLTEQIEGGATNLALDLS